MAKALRFIAAALITMFGISVLTYIGSQTNTNDYVEYWSAGKLFVHGQNPYSSSLIFALEKSRGLVPNEPLIMLNPPWALFMVAPLGFFPAIGALVLWIIATAGSVLLSILALDVPPKYRTMAFLFAPVLATLTMMQSSPFLLLGFSLFLRFHRSRPFLAGASLLLMAIKPHLFLVFWAVLLADCLYRRRFAILAGFAAALACASAAPMLVVPHVWQDYFALMRGATLGQNLFPTLPVLIRLWIDPKLAWLELVPAGIGMVWGTAFYWRNRHRWNWRKEGMLVMLASVFTSPYGWVSDQAVLLPVAVSTVHRPLRRYAMETLTALNLVVLLVFCVSAYWRAWLPLAWLLWYLYAVKANQDSGSGVDVDSTEQREAVAGLSI
ncbi:MAG TPA: glycosyltransferase family 87 protein [Acidobacteriaceae bacterium]|jgi:hypothetical protein|nr:glycosyltransferase family 87 protein [Acidobacteriaceae bacterium]